jgi:hypothetical protein
VRDRLGLELGPGARRRRGAEKSLRGSFRLSAPAVPGDGPTRTTEASPRGAGEHWHARFVYRGLGDGRAAAAAAQRADRCGMTTAACGRSGLTRPCECSLRRSAAFSLFPDNCPGHFNNQGNGTKSAGAHTEAMAAGASAAPARHTLLEQPHSDDSSSAARGARTRRRRGASAARLASATRRVSGVGAASAPGPAAGHRRGAIGLYPLVIQSDSSSSMRGVQRPHMTPTRDGRPGPARRKSGLL